MSEDSFNYFVSCGEPSGDLLAADLVEHLAEAMPHGRPYAITGPRLRQLKVDELGRIDDLAVMGFWDVLKAFAGIKAFQDRLVDQLLVIRPRFIVLVDYPGFNMHLAERLLGTGWPIYQYVAPQLWAWGQRRVKRLRRVTHKVLGILPFEQEFFTNHGVDFTYVGTPQVDRVEALLLERDDFQFLGQSITVGFFPGSRRGELRRILPQMLEIVAEIKERKPEIQLVVSVAEAIQPEFLRREIAGFNQLTDQQLSGLSAIGGFVEWQPGCFLVRGNSVALMKRCQAALVTSGTATLECALTGTPLAVMYVASPFTYAVAKALIDIDTFGLVNLVAGSKIAREFIQDINPAAIAQHILELAIQGDVRSKSLADLQKLRSRVQGRPGRAAAQIIARNQA